MRYLQESTAAGALIRAQRGQPPACTLPLISKIEDCSVVKANECATGGCGEVRLQQSPTRAQGAGRRH